MADDELLGDAFASVEVNADFTQAELTMRDQSRLLFRHTVGERWAKASDEATLAAGVLARIQMFRLNRKHLDIQLADGTRWEIRFNAGGAARG